MKHLKRILLFAIILCSFVFLYPRDAKADVLGDDYPVTCKVGPGVRGVDPWNFYKSECVSFVAWRLNSVNGVPGINGNRDSYFHNYYGGVHWGNANHWDDAARSLGIRVDNIPAVGAIA